MIKVMLVDDEPWILKDLRHLIDWENCGFTLVGEARDYKEAEIRIDLLKPDIIICDICMPGDNGLELMKRMKRKHQNRHIVIFISAYTDFAYAREAIRLGALDYIKKPVDRNNLLHALAAAADQLKNNEEITRQLKDHEAGKLIHELMELSTVKQDIVNKLEAHGFMLSQPYAVAVIKSQIGLNRDVAGELQEWLFAGLSGGSWIKAQLGTRKWMYLLNGYPDNRAAAAHLLRTIKAATVEHGLCVGISRPHWDWRRFRDAYRQADLLADHDFMTDGPAFKRIRLRPHPVVSALVSTLPLSVSSLIWTNWVDRLEKESSRLDMYEITSLYTSFLWRLAELRIDSRAEGAAADKLSFVFKNFQDMLDQMRQSMLESPGQPAKVPQNAVIRNIVLGIEENYGQKLLISDFAAKYRMNSSYLSQLFKQEVGVSFTDYLVNYRLNKAEQLLRDGRFSIEEISDKVGYEDHIHFNKMFKKYKQQTPAAYRKQQRHS